MYIIHYIVEYLQAFSTEKIIKTSYKRLEHKIKIPKQDEYVKFKNFERKTKSLFVS